MCKKVNRFFPLLLLSYIGGSVVLGWLFRNTELPIWVEMLESQMLILIPGILYMVLNRFSIRKCLPYRTPKLIDFLLAMLFGYLMIPAMLLLNYVSMLFSSNRIQEATNQLTVFPFWMQLLFIAVMPACIEEFLFRGVFFHSYRKNGILPAAILSGVVFGVVHLNINQFVYATVLGIVFALLVEATGSMFMSMAAHFAINTYSITLLKILPQSDAAVEKSNELLQNISFSDIIASIVMMGFIAVIFSLLAFLLFRYLSKRSGRWDYFVYEMGNGLRAKNGEKFITPTLAITFAICIIYMITTEYFW